jgi:hypothetical protein
MTHIWYVVNRVPFGDFEDPVEDMLRAYLIQNWGSAAPIVPPKSTNPPYDYTTNVRFGDWEYDPISTYYIRVKEDETNFNNDLIINQGCFQLATTVFIDLSARRLKYGEHFQELNNMRLEVMRILGSYRPDDISGIHLIELEQPGERDIESRNFERSGQLPRTIWYLRIKACLYYIKAYGCP